MDQIQSVVIGAGVIGLAIARALAQSGQDTLILEAQNQQGQGISSRNSEVIHAGFYYGRHTLKTRLCTQGNALLYDFAQRHQVPHRKIGKLIVASQAQNAQLQFLYKQAKENQVDVQWLDQAALAEKEPQIRADCAIYSPNSGIIDSHQLMLSLLDDAQANQAWLVPQTQVLEIQQTPNGFALFGTSADKDFHIQTQRLVIAAGLQSQALTHSIAVYPKTLIPNLHLAKGDYFKLLGKAPVKHLIYPIPEKSLKGLGIHLTLDLQGQARFGPDIEYVQEENYQVNPAKALSFQRAIEQYWPDLKPNQLAPDYAGIRPKLQGPSDNFQDFCIQTQANHGIQGLVSLMGIESPGLTAALAIANYVSGQLKTPSPSTPRKYLMRPLHK